MIYLRFKLNQMRLENKDKKKSNSKELLAICLRLLKDTFWFMNAIHWLPFKNFLWSGKLSTFASGLLGVLAVLCNLTLKLT